MAIFSVRQIGIIRTDKGGSRIELESEFRPAMVGLEGFEYLNILWWFHHCDNEQSRAHLQEESPYAKGPEILGTFATRSPERPNPIALSCAQVTWLDEEHGVIGLAWLDAEDGSPVLDLKPYTPSADRVENPSVPSWCSHWPKNVETSGDFDWAAEFNF